MREVWDETGDNTRAVAAGLERTGRIITAAALIMAAAFCGFLTGSVAGLKQLGLALALGVVIDATLVRCILVPALMAVLRGLNWWLPAPRAPRPRGAFAARTVRGEEVAGALPQPCPRHAVQATTLIASRKAGSW